MPPQQSVSQSLRRNSPVVIAVQIATQMVSLVVLGVLYRTLGPTPYGLVGMVLPLLLLARIVIASGLDVVTIQQAEMSDQQVSALFWLNQALGLTMTAATAVAAPLVAWFYGRPELIGLTLALAATSAAAALGTQHQALLGRKLRVGVLAVLRLGAMLLAGVGAVAAALAGWGVWSLVVQQYVELLALACLVWIVEPWRPGFTLRGVGARRLVHFGGHFAVSNLAFYLIANVDKVLVGFFLGPVPLALYGQAFALMMKPVTVVITPLTGLMLPALSRAAGDRGQYADLLMGFFRFIALLLLPAGVGLAIVAPEAIRVLGGRQWAEAGPILRVLAPVILVQGFVLVLGAVFASSGHPKRLSAASVVIAASLTAAYCLGLYVGNVAGKPLGGTAAAFAGTMVLLVAPGYLMFALRTVGVPPRRFIRVVGPPAGAALAMGVVVAACHVVLVGVPDFALLAIEVGLGVAVYALLARRDILWFLRRGMPWERQAK